MNTPEDWYLTEQLHFAAQDGDTNRLEQLVSEGYDVNAFDELGMTPLHYAASEEHFDAVRVLLAHGADVNARDEAKAGDSPIAHIAQTCSLEMARLLLGAGADPLLPGMMQVNAIHRAQRRKRGDGPLVYELLCHHVGKSPERRNKRRRS